MEKIFKIFNNSIDISVFLYYNIDTTSIGGVDMKCDNTKCKHNQLNTYVGVLESHLFHHLVSAANLKKSDALHRISC